MNNQVKFPKILEELNDNMAVDGYPPKDDFSGLCDYVTRWMIRKYDLDNDAGINYGYCFIWAYLVWALWPGEGVTFLTTTGHVVVKFEGHYYDSEHCEGYPEIDGWCGFYKNCERKLVDVKTMCWYWSRAGKKLRELRRIIRKVHPSLYKSVRDNGNAHWRNSIEDFPAYKHLPNLPEVA